MLLFLAIFVGACGPSGVGAVRPERKARTNVLLSFAPDWTCAGWDHAGECQAAIAAQLARKFAPYDVAFWLASDRVRVDGITVFFETSLPQDWGAGIDTVGYSPERCAPESHDGLITGAVAVFSCGASAYRGPLFCTDVTAHEIGHLLGLEHVLMRSDQMTAVYRAPTEFGKRPLTTDINRCRDEQDDGALLMEALGPAL